MRRLVLSGLLVGLFLTSASGQQRRQPPPPAPTSQTPTFRLDVEYVEVDARVTDDEGRFVRDLTKEDFRVVVDGKRQTIEAFSLVDIPIEPAPQSISGSVSFEADVQSNERRFDGRLYVLMLDDKNTAPDRTTRTKAAARRFIEQHLGANDLAAIVFTQYSEPAQEFTSNKRLLLAAVDKFGGDQEPERTLPPPIGPGFGSGDDPPLFSLGDGFNLDGLRVMRNLTRLTAWLSGINGRKKAVVFFSDGFPYDQAGLDEDSRPNGRIGRTNVHIYAVDMNGPGTVQTAIGQLTMLSENTGGFVVVDNTDIDRGFDRLVAENSTYYLLAYYPTHPRDGKFRPIEVHTTRPGLTVQARRGYTAPKGDATPRRFAVAGRASAATIEALNSPIQLGDLRMRVFAAPFRTAARAAVVIGIELVGADLPLDTGGAVEIAYLAVDAKEKERGFRTDRLNVKFEAGMRARVEQSGVRVLKRMELPPGRYRLHVAAHDPVSNRSGSLIHDLEVPEFGKKKFALSGIVLMSKSNAAMVTPHADEQVRGMLPGLPTASRTFSVGDEIAAFAELYDAGGEPSRQLDIVSRVRSATGDAVFEKAETHELGKTHTAHRHMLQVPLATFAPGDYVLSVEAASRGDANRTAVRHVPFTVRAAGPAR